MPPHRISDRRGLGRRHLHADGAVPVGATNIGTELSQTLEHRRVGMPVRVVASDRDQRHGGVHGTQEPWVVGVAAVVGNLQQTDRQPRRRPQQMGLRVGFGIAGQQRGTATPGGPQHDRGVVHVTIPGGHRHGSGAQHLDGQIPHPRDLSGGRPGHGDAPPARCRDQAVDGLGNLWLRYFAGR